MTIKAGISRQREVYRELRADILGGRYVASRFPSERALAVKFGVGRSTMTRCLTELEREGLVRRRQGKGTFLTDLGALRLVGVVIPGIAYSSEFFQPIVTELIRQAKRRDYSVVMDGVWSPHSEVNAVEMTESVARLIRQRVAGVIYQPLAFSRNSEAINFAVLSAFSKAGIPVVLLDGDVVSLPRRSEYDLVSIDNVAAGEMLGWHLIEQGARSIRYFMRAAWVQNVLNRAHGVRNAVLANGLRWSEQSIVRAAPSDVAAVRRLMRSTPRPDAIVCENDVIAATLKKTLESLGYVVPGDLLLAGFDDVQIARLSSPGITTIRQPCEEIARTALERLLARIANRELVPTSILLPHQLIVRSSTLSGRQAMREGSGPAGVKQSRAGRCPAGVHGKRAD